MRQKVVDTYKNQEGSMRILVKRFKVSFAWIVLGGLGLIESGVINLTQWVSFIQSRTTFAQSQQF